MGGESWRIVKQRDRSSASIMSGQVAAVGWLVEALLRPNFLEWRMRAAMVQEHLA